VCCSTRLSLGHTLPRPKHRSRFVLDHFNGNRTSHSGPVLHPFGRTTRMSRKAATTRTSNALTVVHPGSHCQCARKCTRLLQNTASLAIPARRRCPRTLSAGTSAPRGLAAPAGVQNFMRSTPRRLLCFRGKLSDASVRYYGLR
jgi:hypothetical protein